MGDTLSQAGIPGQYQSGETDKRAGMHTFLSHVI